VSSVHKRKPGRKRKRKARKLVASSFTINQYMYSSPPDYIYVCTVELLARQIFHYVMLSQCGLGRGTREFTFLSPT
jgi:hypothetical protein